MIPYQLLLLLPGDDLGLVFTGIVDDATGTLIGTWSNVITARADTGPITARAETTVKL